MRKAVAQYRKACKEAKCERCKRESRRDSKLDFICGQCLVNMPEYPYIKTQPAKAASELYSWLKIKSDDDIEIDQIAEHFSISIKRAYQLVNQLNERRLVEFRDPFVWAYEGRLLS